MLFWFLFSSWKKCCRSKAYFYFATTHVDVTNAWRSKNTLYHNLHSLWKPAIRADRPMLSDVDGCTMWWFICWFWLVLSAMPMDLTIGVLWMGVRDPLTPTKIVDWKWIEESAKVHEMHSRCISRITMLWGKHAKKDVMCQSKSRRLITGHLRSQVSRCFKMSRDLCLERPKDSAFPWRYGTQAHMEWTVNVWLPKYYRQNLDTDPQPGRVAIQNQIIGGSRLHKEYWQTGQPGDGPKAAIKGWFNRVVEEVEVMTNVWKRSLSSQLRRVRKSCPKKASRTLHCQSRTS